MSAQLEQWLVSTHEGNFETDLETLKQWIIEGAVLPTDKVSKGNLNWIEAGRVPRLRGAFNGEVSGPSVTQPEQSVDQVSWQTPPPVEQPHATQANGHAHKTGAASNSCHNHPGVAAVYVCRMCSATFCAECPRFAGGGSKVPICPLCGDMCRSYQAATRQTSRVAFQRSGFGISDFVRALGYPFQHKIALVGGAALYGFLLLAGLRGSLLAWMLMFGCISQVISQVAWGRLHRSFMPDFSDFSMLDNVVQPFFLSIGIAIVSWGPMLVLAIVVVFGMVSSGAVKPNLAQTAVAASQSDAPTAEDLSVLTDPNADPKKLEEANRKLNGMRPGSQIGKEVERSKQDQSDPTAVVQQIAPYLGGGIFLLMIFLILAGWGIFYYPMALTVAGYTQSFVSVINPLVGLDTIRRMRSTYFKAFAMVLLLQLVSLIIGGVVAYITSPFALPFMGNLPANFINGGITFYFNLVIACLLGLSLYKCADRLAINVD
jgi:hypothetical protein